MTSTIEQGIKKKRALFRQYKRNLSPSSRQEFNSQRNKVTNLLRRAERAHGLKLYRESLSNQSSSTTSFWDFARSLAGRSHHHPIPDIYLSEDNPINSPSGKADAFNTFFAEQTHLDDSTQNYCPTTKKSSPLYPPLQCMTLRSSFPYLVGKPPVWMALQTISCENAHLE